MNILVAGASGLIGKAITVALENDGHKVYPLIRNKRQGPFHYIQEKDEISLDNSIPLDVIINLAGVNISERRWSKAVKNEIADSRIRTTIAISREIANLEKKPNVFLSASAIGYYGNDSKDITSESSPAGSDFLAQLSVDWEKATEPAQAAGIRTCILRFGLVLSPRGGLIKNLLLPLRLACVGPIGSGDQILSWISLQDTTSIMQTVIESNSFKGPINLVSNHPVSSRQFSEALSSAIKRPALPRIPEKIVRLMFGELADAALLANANITSTRINELDATLKHTNLFECLNDIMGK